MAAVAGLVAPVGGGVGERGQRHSGKRNIYRLVWELAVLLHVIVWWISERHYGWGFTSGSDLGQYDNQYLRLRWRWFF